MKHDTGLRKFLEDYVNINSTRLDKAKNIVSPTDGSLIKYLRINLGESFTSIYQGSFSYHTIIKPDKSIDDGKYDVDIAIQLDYNSDWEGEEYKYHDCIIDCLEASDRYSDKIDKSKERAIRVQYDSNDEEFHVDLVPMFHDGINWNVVDRQNNTVEISGGTEFRDWVNTQNNKTSVDGSSKKFLKEVIRLYKFLRNQTDSDLIRSVQLTLLLARQIDKLDEEDFIDLTTTFYKISVELRNELDGITEISDLDLSNPGLPEEIFDRNFTDEQFQDFKAWAIDLSGKIEEAYNESNEDESLKKWIDIFGENFSSKKDLSKTLLPVVYRHAQDPLNYGFRRSNNVQKIQIIGTKMTSRFSRSPCFFSSNSPIDISRGNVGLKFTAKCHPIIQGQLYWQVTNEDNQYVNDKRGRIEGNRVVIHTYKGPCIEETASWHGKHWVKCFMVNSQNDIIGESDPFYVNIS